MDILSQICLVLALYTAHVHTSFSSPEACDIRKWYLTLISDEVFNTDLTPAMLDLKQNIEALVLRSSEHGKTDCRNIDIYNAMLKDKFNYNFGGKQSETKSKSIPDSNTEDKEPVPLLSEVGDGEENRKNKDDGINKENEKESKTDSTNNQEASDKVVFTEEKQDTVSVVGETQERHVHDRTISEISNNMNVVEHVYTEDETDVDETDLADDNAADWTDSSDSEEENETDDNDVFDVNDEPDEEFATRSIPMAVCWSFGCLQSDVFDVFGLENSVDTTEHRAVKHGEISDKEDLSKTKHGEVHNKQTKQSKGLVDFCVTKQNLCFKKCYYVFLKSLCVIGYQDESFVETKNEIPGTKQIEINSAESEIGKIENVVEKESKNEFNNESNDSFLQNLSREKEIPTTNKEYINEISDELEKDQEGSNGIESNDVLYEDNEHTADSEKDSTFVDQKNIEVEKQTLADEKPNDNAKSNTEEKTSNNKIPYETDTKENFIDLNADGKQSVFKKEKTITYSNSVKENDEERAMKNSNADILMRDSFNSVAKGKEPESQPQKVSVFADTGQSTKDTLEAIEQESSDLLQEIKEVDSKIDEMEKEVKQSTSTSTGQKSPDQKVSVDEFEKIIHQTTSQYAQKIQTLELMISKLENQLLIEKLNKQNHSSTITRLENLILKLENDFLKLNTQYDEMKTENENISKRQNHYLEIAYKNKQQSSKQLELPDRSAKASELLSQHQSKITELTDILRNQSLIIKAVKDRYNSLEDQNRMLHQMIMNQTIFMTSIIQTMQDLSTQNSRNKEQIESLKEKLANKADINSNHNGKHIPRDNIIEALDKYVVDDKINIEGSDPSTGGDDDDNDDDDDADLNLKLYLRHKPAEDIITKWCPKENDTCPSCYYRKIISIQCIPFRPLFWGYCGENCKHIPMGRDQTIEKGMTSESASEENRLVENDTKNTPPDPNNINKEPIEKSKNSKNKEDRKINDNEVKSVSEEIKQTDKIDNKSASRPEINAHKDSDEKDNLKSTEKAAVSTKENSASKKNENNEGSNDGSGTNERNNNKDLKSVATGNNEENTVLGNVEQHNANANKGSVDVSSSKEDSSIASENKKGGGTDGKANSDGSGNNIASSGDKGTSISEKTASNKNSEKSGKGVRHEGKPKSGEKTKSDKMSKDSSTGIRKESEEKNQQKEKTNNKVDTKKQEGTSKHSSKPAGKQKKVPVHLVTDRQDEPKDCFDYYKRGNKKDGIFKIHLVGLKSMIDVFCDMKNGGWTVIQRRQDGTMKFFQEWNMYKKGFGGLYGEHWLGNDNIHYLTNQDYYKLRVDLMDWDKNKKYAEYDYFLVENEENGYRVNVDGYTGDAGDGFSKHNGHKFSTKDVDNDKVVKEFGGSCAVRFYGAGWYYKCYASNLNGKYYKGGKIPEKKFDGVTWKPWTGPNYSLKKVEMKIKPVSAK